MKKRQRRLSEVDEIVISLYTKGMTTGEISAHFAEIYGASVSKETISRITDKVVAEMTEWSTRPLDSVYAAVFIDAIVVKVRDGQVANRPIYAAIGVTVDGHKDVLGLWAGTGGEGCSSCTTVSWSDYLTPPPSGPGPVSVKPACCWRSSATGAPTCCASSTTYRFRPRRTRPNETYAAKIQQKISGRLTSEQRTKDRYTILGYVSSAAKNGLDKMAVLRDAILGRPWMPDPPAPT